MQDTLAFWEEAPWDAKARLVENGKIVNASDLGLGNKDRVDLIELMLRSEDALPTECQAPPHASDRGVDAKFFGNPTSWQFAIRNLRLLATVFGEAVYVHLSIGQRGYVMSIFKNKIAIVTGAASGIGQALARDLARQGVDVVPADVQINAANTFVAGICRSGGKASAHYLDVTDSDVVEGFVRRIAAEKGRLDYMFNNAGIAIIGEFRDFSTADWKRILDINVCGVLAGTAAAYGVMIRLGHESIETTQVYLDADLAMKQAVLDKTQPPEGKPGRYRPDDPLLAFLKGL